MFAQKLERFVVENNLPVDKTQELMQLFNDSLIEIGEFIINNSNDKKSKVKHTPVVTNQKWASKVAQAFAEEKELTLDDFPGVEKVTKAHMLEFIKNKPTTTTKTKKVPSLVTKPKEAQSPAPSYPTPIVGKGKKVTCAGITDKGDVCTRTGTITPDGAKKCYCFRHADKWRDFEEIISSDSDTELNLEVPSVSKDKSETNDIMSLDDTDTELKLEMPSASKNKSENDSDEELEPSSPISQKSTVKDSDEESDEEMLIEE